MIQSEPSIVPVQFLLIKKKEIIKTIQSRFLEIEPILKAIKPKIGGSIQNWYDFMNEKIKSQTGFDDNQVPFFRERVKEVETILIKEICKLYLNPRQRIIEIGAGQLDPQGYSYFMQRLPEDLKSIVEPTEVNRYHITSPSLTHVDTLELDKSYSLDSLDRIISSAVLDTLSNKDLLITLRKTYAVLKNRGLLIHISSLEPFQDIITSHYATKNTVTFPWIHSDGQFLGVQVISKQVFSSFLKEKEKKFSNKESNFFKWYSKLDPYCQESIINDLMIQNTLKDKQIRTCFSDWLLKLQPPQMQLISNKKFFEERLREKLKETGFNILEFGSKTQCHIIKRPNNFPENLTDNYFSLNQGTYYEKNCCVLNKGYIYQHVQMQVIVAEKKLKTD